MNLLNPLAFRPLIRQNVIGEQMAKTGAVLRYEEFWTKASALPSKHDEPRFVSLSLPSLKRLLAKGLQRGIIAEISGRRSSGRTSVCLYTLAQATARGEFCAVIDLHDRFHPASAAAAGVGLDHLVWVRCRGNAEYAIRATDLLLHAGGFGVVLLDVCEANARDLKRIPLSYWHRFRRVVEHTPTILMICAEARQSGSCSSTSIAVKRKTDHWSGKPPFLVLRGFEAHAETPASFREPSSCSFQTIA